MSDKIDNNQSQPVVNQSTKPVNLADALTTDAPVQSQDWKEAKSQSDIQKPSNFNPLDYTDYVEHPRVDDPTLDYQRAENQSTGEKLGHLALQTAASLAGGFLSSAGIALDLKQTANTMIGDEDNYHNLLYDAGVDLTNKAGDRFPIYEKNQPEDEEGNFNKARLTDPSYWMNKIGQLAYTGGAMAYSMLETYGITAATAGLGDEAEIPLAEQRMGMLEKVFSVKTNSDKLRNNSLLFGLVNRNNLSVMDAAQTFDATMDELTKKGVPEEEAKLAASKAAAFDYRVNIPLALVDAATIGLMKFNPITGQGEGAMQRLMSKIPNAPLRIAIQTGVEMAAGGYEQLHRAVGQLEGQYRGDLIAGQAKESNFSDRLSKEVNSNDIWDNTITGLLTGLLMEPIGMGYHKLTESADIKSKKMEHLDFIKNSLSQSIQLADQIKNADESNNESASSALRAEAGQVMALKGLHLDHLLNRDDGFFSYRDNLQSTLDIINSGDEDKVNELLTKEATPTNKILDTDGKPNPTVINNIKSEFPKYLADADKIKQLYDVAKETVDPTAIIPIVNRQFHIGVMTDYLNKITPQIDELKNRIPEYNNLSENGKFILTLSSELDALNKNQKELLIQLRSADTDEAKREGIKQALDEIHNRKEELNNYNESIKDDRTIYSDKDRETDNSIIKSMPEQVQLKTLQYEKTYLELQKENYKKQLEIWNNPKFQKKNRMGAYHNEIDKASTQEELNSIQDKLKKSNELTDEISNVIDQKSKELKYKQQRQENIDKINSQKVETKENESELADLLSVPEKNEPEEPEHLQEPEQINNQVKETLINNLKEANSDELNTNLIEKDPEQYLQQQIDYWTNKQSEKGQKTKATKELNKLKKIQKQFNWDNVTQEQQDKIEEQKQETINELTNDIISTTPFGKPLDNITETPTHVRVEEESLFEKSDEDEQLWYDPKVNPNNIPVFDAKIKLLYDALNTGTKPLTFREFIEDFIKSTNREAVQEKFDAIKDSYVRNKLPEDDYEKVKNDIFKNLQDLRLEILNERLEEQNENTIISSSLLDKGLDNQTTYLHDSYATSQSTLKMAYLSVDEERQILPLNEDGTVNWIKYANQVENLNVSDYVDSRPILNPDAFKSGDTFIIKIADNPNDIPVSKWNNNNEREKGILFSQWIKDNNIVEGSDDYIAKIPIFIHMNGVDKPVATVHDLEWYNKTNIGIEGEPDAQRMLIKQARQELMALRRAIYEKKEIKGTVLPNEVTKGSKWLLPKDAPYQSIFNLSPEAEPAFCNSNRDMITANGVIEPSSFINKEDFMPGISYVVYRWRTDNNGKPTYLAVSSRGGGTNGDIKINRIDELTQSSVWKAVYLFLNREQLSEEEKETVKQIRSITGLDLKDADGLQKYLEHFILVRKENLGSGSTKSQVENLNATLFKSKEIADFTPIITINKENIIFGVKGVGTIYYSNGITSHTPANMKSMVETLATKLVETLSNHAKNFHQNINKDALQQNKNIAFIDKDGNVSKGKSYNNHLKDVITSNIRSTNINDENQKPVYATAIQPVVNYDWEGRNQAVLDQQPLVQEDSKKNTIVIPNATDLNTNKNLSNISIEELNNKIADIEARRSELTARKINVDRLIQKLKDDSGIIFKEPSYQKILDNKDENGNIIKNPLIQRVSKKILSINGLETGEKSQLVRFISRSILSYVDAEYKSEVSMEDINKVIQGSFDKIFNRVISQNKLDREMFSFDADTMKALDDELHNIDLIKQNYDSLINEAKVEIKKYTGIVEKIKKEDSNDETSEEAQQEDEESELNENEQSENYQANIDSYSKSSLEENAKSSTTYKVRRFLAQMPKYTLNGDVEKGFLGIDIYPGYDYYFNKVISLLTNPAPLLHPTFDELIGRLTNNIGKQSYVNELITRIKQADLEIQNGFVSALNLDSSNFNQVRYGERKSKKTSGLYNVDSSNVVTALIEKWFQQFNHTNLVNSTETESNLHIKNAQVLLEQFNKWNTTRQEVDEKTKKVRTVKNLPTAEEALKWLDSFGITLNSQTMNELIAGNLFIESEGKNKRITYKFMFDKSATSNGIFGVLADKLQTLINRHNDGLSTDFIDNEELHPLFDVSGIFNKVAKIDATYDTYVNPTSHRDGGKTISNQTPPKLLTQLFNKLVNDPEWRKNKLGITFDQHSYLLNLVNQIEVAGNKLYMSHVAITSLKEYGKDAYTDTELNALSDKDHEYFRVIAHQDQQQGNLLTTENTQFTINGKEYNLPFRMATMLTPTMSDKKTMLNMRMPILKFTKNSFEYESIFIRKAHDIINPTKALETWDLGKFEGQPEENHKQEINDYTVNHPNKVIGDTGESFNEFKNRILTVFENLLETAKNNTMIVTHSSVVKMFTLWDKEGRPDFKTMSDTKLKDFAQKYIKESSETGDVRNFKSKDGNLIVARHGETEDNLAGNLRSPNTQLTAKGIADAKAIGEQLKGTVIPAIYSSHLSRAIHTSNIALGEIEGKEPISEIEEKQKVKSVSNEVRSFIYSQIVEPELNRIIKHHVDTKRTNSSPDSFINQKDVNKGRQIFHFISDLNNITYKGDRLIAYIANNAETLNADTIKQELIEGIREQIDGVIDRTISQLVEDKINNWKKNEFFILDDNENIVNNNKLNQKYLDSFHEKDMTNKATMAAYDYVTSCLLSNANMHMLFDGDIANFSQDKSFEHKDENGKYDRFIDGSPFKPINEDGNMYNIAMQEISTNLGKRLAMMIASGKYITSENNEKYLQLYLQDQKTRSTNLDYLIGLYYPKKDYTKEVKENIAKLDTKIDNKEYKTIVDDLKNKFPLIADYFDIESTDAQEYITIKEAIDIIFKQGRMPVEMHKRLMDKINTQKKLEKAGQTLTNDVLFTNKELQTISSIFKPVYTNIEPNLVENNSRVDYVKSSAFALIPQLTMGKELDGLRKHMEQIEEQTGHNVHASYGSANKIGNVLKSNNLQIWNQDNTYNSNAINVNRIVDNIKNQGVDQSARLLNRENFRIQQDVPFKSDKKTFDHVAYGTQMMKEILADGIADIEDKIFKVPGHSDMSGKEILDYFNDLHVQWLRNEKSRLYEDLKTNEIDGTPTNVEEKIQKLQEILEEETGKRAGFTKQDLEALKLQKNKDGSNAEFILPVWLAPNAWKYESLLNAVVSNRLTKLKMPGSASVLGSEQGFKLQHDFTGVDMSNVVYTNKFNGELKAAYTDENGVFHKAQVFVNSKFRNKNGKLIDLTSPKYSYKDKETGRLMLRMDMIDESLLNNTSFRIPTSAHVSMSQVEVVGFIPTNDLMIVPKNFTKQKGLDFDVDKETWYQQYHFTEEGGKIMPISEDESKKENRKYQSKLIQNELVRTYSAILGNGDERIQKKINKVLSMDFAREQAIMIDDLINKNTGNKIFTPLSDQYQKQKMRDAAIGKDAIAIYAQATTLHSLIQQSKQPIRLMTSEFDEDGKGKIVPFVLHIGNVTSDGTLGRLMTLGDNNKEGDRSVVTVLGAEKLSTGTDNEKEQILPRVNINEVSINLDTILSALGFDKTTLADKKTEISIPYFICSQPIIREYVEMVRNANSIISEFDKDKQQKILDKLYLNYGGNIFEDKENGSMDIRIVQDDVLQKMRRSLTGQILYNNIAKEVDNKIQQTILHLFTSLINDYSETMIGLSSKLNIQGNGLGKSTFEMLNKFDYPEWFTTIEHKISNTESLIGDYIPIPIDKEDEGYDKTEQEWYDEGYIKFNDYYIKPTTPVGAILTNAVKSGKELWSDFFPHSNPVLAKTFDNIINLLGNPNIRDNKRVKLKQTFFDELKKYLFTSPALGLFSNDIKGTDGKWIRGENAVVQERERLFMDKNGKDSIAGYLTKLLHNKDFKEIIENNKILNSFTYKLEKGNSPSLVKYNAGDSEDFNEEYKYQALIELMDANTPLPSFAGDNEYTTRKLAHDLAIYCYSGSSIQKAIEFVKYIPIAYLQEMGFTDQARMWQRESNNSNNSIWKGILGNVDAKEWTVGRFERQVIQHFPEKVSKINTDMMLKSSIEKENGKKTYNITSFELISEAEPKLFVSLYNNEITKGNKYQLYQFDGEKYRRISVLGSFGMSEYDIRNDNAQSLVRQLTSKTKVENNEPIRLAPAQLPIIQNKESLYDINKGSLKGSIKQITEINESTLSDSDKTKALIDVAKLILPYLHEIPLYIKDLNEANGIYDRTNKEFIGVDKKYLGDKNTTNYEVARTLLHEAVHSITAKELSIYFDKDNNVKEKFGDKEGGWQNLPNHVTKLIRVFNDVQKNMSKEIAEWKAWKAANDKGLTSSDSNVTKESLRLGYGAMSIFEFTTMIMSEPEFQQKMDTFKYKGTQKTILEAFFDAIKTILTKVGIKFNKDTLATHGIDAVLRLIDNTKENKQNKENENLINSFSQFGIKNETSENDNKFNELSYLNTIYDEQKDPIIGSTINYKGHNYIVKLSDIDGSEEMGRRYSRKSGNRENRHLIYDEDGQAGQQMSNELDKQIQVYNLEPLDWSGNPEEGSPIFDITNIDLAKNGFKTLSSYLENPSTRYLIDPNSEDWQKEKNNTDCIF